MGLSCFSGFSYYSLMWDLEFFSLDFLWCNFDYVSFQLFPNNAVIFVSELIALKFLDQAGKMA